MLSFFADNIWTIIICAVLLGIVIAIITNMVTSRVKFLRPLTPPYVPFGIRRFNSISKYAV